MAGIYNFTIDQGSDYSLLATYKDESKNYVDLTGKTLQGSARANKESDSVAFSFEFEIRDQVLHIGQFYLKLSNNVSSGLDISVVDRFLYDVELSDNGKVTRLFQGVVTFSREITR